MTEAPCAAILGCLGPGPSASESAFFREANPWGFILFARNVENPDQLRRLTSDLRACVGREAPVFVDQEGGRVQRLRAPHWSEWQAPLDMVAQVTQRFGPQAAARAMWLRYRLIAAELRVVGIDGNCAPCLDVATPETHPFLRNRCYSDNPATVALLGRAVAEGHLAGGVLPVLKHIPGHGRGTVDSHKGLPVVTSAPNVLEKNDYVPFKALADMPVAMTAHVVYTDLDPDQPATTSPHMIREIRERIGFDGLIMTDDLSMNALSGSVGQRARAAVRAGVDIALHCNGELSEMQAVVAATGPLAGPAQTRAARALKARTAPDSVDIAALRAEFLTLHQGPEPSWPGAGA